MPIKTETPTKAQIDELRARFQRKLQQEPPAVPFHPVDLHRIQDEDLWLTRFLELNDLDMEVSFTKLWETCIWRQQYGAYDLNESNLRQEYLNDGVIFSRNHDVDGKPLLIFRTKLHTKGTKDMDEVIKVVVYWIERLQREKHLQQMTIIFDMSNTGLTSMDLDFVKRIIEVFKMYYPNCLNYILVYEMAWVLNAAFKIIKGLLPAKALEILKVISKKEINTYIDKDNCLVDWEGNDDYAFKFVPETRPADKKVHFANGSPMRVPPGNYDLYDAEPTGTPGDMSAAVGSSEMLRISPKTAIIFSREANLESTVDITCTSKVPITFKIQTTSPEKFRVRPRCGVLYPGDMVSVSILLKSDHHLAEGAKDKFLVMCTSFPTGEDTSAAHLAELWKQKPMNASEVEQHRLCCTYDSSEKRNGYGRGGDSDTVGAGKPGAAGSSISDLSKMAKDLERQLKFTQIMQAVTLIFLLILSGAVLYLLKMQMDKTEPQNGGGGGDGLHASPNFGAGGGGDMYGRGGGGGAGHSGAPCYPGDRL